MHRTCCHLCAQPVAGNSAGHCLHQHSCTTCAATQPRDKRTHRSFKLRLLCSDCFTAGLPRATPAVLFISLRTVLTQCCCLHGQLFPGGLCACHVNDSALRGQAVPLCPAQACGSEVQAGARGARSCTERSPLQRVGCVLTMQWQLCCCASCALPQCGSSLGCRGTSSRLYRAAHKIPVGMEPVKCRMPCFREYNGC